MIEIARLKSPILLHLLDFVDLCHKDAKLLDPWMYDYHRYITVIRGEVKRGQSQGHPDWHVDNPEEKLPIYIVVEGEPTQFKAGKSKELVIYRLGPEDLHRSPKVKKTHLRTYLRLAYSKRLYKYTGVKAGLNMMVLG